VLQVGELPVVVDDEDARHWTEVDGSRLKTHPFSGAGPGGASWSLAQPTGF